VIGVVSLASAIVFLVVQRCYGDRASQALGALLRS